MTKGKPKAQMVDEFNRWWKPYQRKNSLGAAAMFTAWDSWKACERRCLVVATQNALEVAAKVADNYAIECAEENPAVLAGEIAAAIRAKKVK
jgi:hypothetical protein